MVLICKTENRVNAFSLFFLKLFWLFPLFIFRLWTEPEFTA